jgi:hypothetical protein
MIDIAAALSLAIAASKAESTGQLFADAQTLYSVYAQAKAGTLNIQKLADAGQLKPTIQAAARVLSVANGLVEDPAQLKNITELLASL